MYFQIKKVVQDQGRNHETTLGEAKPMGERNLPPLVEVVLMYLKI